MRVNNPKARPWVMAFGFRRGKAKSCCLDLGQIGLVMITRPRRLTADERVFSGFRACLVKVGPSASIERIAERFRREATLGSLQLDRREGMAL